jgi:hypothetical protein
MKTLQRTLAAFAVGSLMAAQPLAAAPVARNAAPTAKSEQLGGHASNALIIILVFGALLGLFAVAGLFDHSDKPHSP